MDVRKHHISVAGHFEPGAIALSSIGSIKVLENSESHVLFSLRNGAAALARSTSRFEQVEVETVIVDDDTGAAASTCQTLLSVVDYKVVLVPNESAIDGGAELLRLMGDRSTSVDL